MKSSHTHFHLIVIRGGIIWGILTALLVQTILYFTGEKSFGDGLLSSLLIFPVVGVTYGYIIWKFRNRKNNKN